MPLPLEPTMAVILPSGISRSMSLSTNGEMRATILKGYILQMDAVRFLIQWESATRPSVSLFFPVMDLTQAVQAYFRILRRLYKSQQLVERALFIWPMI